MITRMYNNWRQRHLKPINFWLHMPGIAGCFIVAPILLATGLYAWAAGFFVGGYILQFLGHALEGNRSGEEMLLRRMLGKKNC